MSLLNKLRETADNTMKETADTLGGFNVLASGLYALRIKSMFYTASASGAIAVNIRAETQEGENVEFQDYVTNSTAKGGVNYYLDKSGARQPMRGFATMDALCRLTDGRGLMDIPTEVRHEEIYNVDDKKRVLTPVDMIEPMVGQIFYGGILHTKENVNLKDAQGVYQPSDKYREENELDKVFNDRKLTITEQNAGATEPTFCTKWEEANKDKLRDRSKTPVIMAADATPAKQATPGAVPSTMQTAPAVRTPASALFANG